MKIAGRAKGLNFQQKLVAFMSYHWFKEFASYFEFPSNYVCIDVETSGFDRERDFICSIGHVVVRDNEIVESKEHYLNWAQYDGIDLEDFKYRLDRTKRSMEAAGKGFYHSYEKLTEDGEAPTTVLMDYLTLFEEMEERDEVLVAHNGWGVDMQFLQAHFYNWLRVPFKFSPHLVYDSGIIEKASQLGLEDNPLPALNENLMDFSARIGGMRRKDVRWSLDTHCEKQYALTDKVRAAGYAGEDHQALYDAVKLHFLLEEHRALSKYVDD